MTVRPNGDLEVDILSCKATVTAGITSAAALEKAARGYVCTESSDDDANLARFAQCFARYALDARAISRRFLRPTILQPAKRLNPDC
jgi:hypothetical protein